MKTWNNYADLFPNYEKTPKAVIAALAFSLAMRLEEEDAIRAVELLEEEWLALHRAGIVPQKPRAPVSGKKTDEERECPTCGGSGEDSQHFWAPGTLYSDDGEFNATPVPLACTDCEGYGTFQP